MSNERLSIDIWSDVMCPWCYLGDTMLDQALQEFEHGDQVDVKYHSYQLMPELAPETDMNLNEMLVTERGYPREQAEAMNAEIAKRGDAIGLEFRFDRAVAANTRAAHRLLHFADEHGRQHELVIRLFKAFFTDGLRVGNHEVLADLAAEVGLDRDAALAALNSEQYEDAVTADIDLARQYGINGVPFFVIDGKYAISGAQPTETFRQALDTVWRERSVGEATQA